MNDTHELFDIVSCLGYVAAAQVGLADVVIQFVLVQQPTLLVALPGQSPVATSIGHPIDIPHTAASLCTADALVALCIVSGGIWSADEITKR